jgi:hypothetical protein
LAEAHQGTVEKYSPLVFFVTFRDPKGHDSTVENTLSSAL